MARRLLGIMERCEVANPEFDPDPPENAWIGLVIQDRFRERSRELALLEVAEPISEIYIVWRATLTRVRGEGRRSWSESGRELEAWLVARVIEHGGGSRIAKLNGFDLHAQLAARPSW